MALTYYHSFEMGPHIPLTFPPQMAVISRATEPIPDSLIFTYLHCLFLILAQSASFSSRSCPFLRFCSWLLHVISPFCVFPHSVFSSFSHLLTFCSVFYVIHHIFFFSLSFLTFTSHLISSSPFCGLSPPALFLSVSVFTCSIH